MVTNIHVEGERENVVVVVVVVVVFINRLMTMRKPVQSRHFPVMCTLISFTDTDSDSDSDKTLLPLLEFVHHFFGTCTIKNT